MRHCRSHRLDARINRGKHLNRPRDIEQLHRRIGEHVDDPDRVWRGSEGILAFPANYAQLGSVCLTLTSDQEQPMIPLNTHPHIGSLLFEGIDQIDLTGPFTARPQRRFAI